MIKETYSDFLKETYSDFIKKTLSDKRFSQGNTLRQKIVLQKDTLGQQHQLDLILNTLSHIQFCHYNLVMEAFHRGTLAKKHLVFSLCIEGGFQCWPNTQELKAGADADFTRVNRIGGGTIGIVFVIVIVVGIDRVFKTDDDGHCCCIILVCCKMVTLLLHSKML